ncbi:MAG: tetratricopeptide repeat-containing protein [Halopseudomonas sp.]
MANSGQARPHQSALVLQAREQLQADPLNPKATLELAKQLKNQERAFGYARKLLARAIELPDAPISSELNKRLSQQLALCTYKDPDLQPAIQLDDAFKILNDADSLALSSDLESLGLAGAIYKRKWEHGNHKQHLERSLAYYRRGYEQYADKGWQDDEGYNAINAAFVLDLLGFQEQREALKAKGSTAMAERRFAEAEQIRKAITTNLTPLLEQAIKRAAAQQTEDQNVPSIEPSWWPLVTLGEAYFGLGFYSNAQLWLSRAAELERVSDWELESTARQLASLLRLRIGRGEAFAAERQPAVELLQAFLGDKDALLSVLNGKIGLALSGGGFRASLYHIGVLARLAELDLLRQVEVISCVSGGSIVGAHYYLEVRKLLQTKTDKAINKEHYIEIVKRVEEQFLVGVQSNIRTRVVTNLWANLKMMLYSDYSRTNRLGELYEEQLYKRVPDNEGDAPRYLNRLQIHPLDADDDFRPKDHNWKRNAKVPILVLNATSLNTGHNWQFTASWMGEPPAGIDSEIDANYRLRRMYYPDAPKRFQSVRLGDAVAASSCVPGLFEPLPLTDLYPDITVRLVDGGVYDNQGSAGLLDQGCSVLLVSDASGQMAEEDQPGIGLLDVPLRSSSILQTRVRSAQYHELDARLRSGLLQGLMYIHMKKDLHGRSQDWEGCLDPSPSERAEPVTCYGINAECQSALADIRTDLDSFTTYEGKALMLSGYRMTEYYCPPELTQSLSLATDDTADINPPVKAVDWGFFTIARRISGNKMEAELLNQFRVGKQTFFKVWQLSPGLKMLRNLMLIALVLGLGTWFLYSRNEVLFHMTVGGFCLVLVTVLINRFGGGWLLNAINYRKTLKQVVLGGVALVAGWNIAQLHLRVFDKLFLKIGGGEAAANKDQRIRYPKE